MILSRLSPSPSPTPLNISSSTIIEDDEDAMMLTRKGREREGAGTGESSVATAVVATRQPSNHEHVVVSKSASKTSSIDDEERIRIQLPPPHEQQQQAHNAAIRTTTTTLFPVVDIPKSDWETIPHPSIVYGSTLPPDLSQTLMVPKFWKPTVNLKKNMSLETAKSIGSFYYYYNNGTTTTTTTPDSHDHDDQHQTKQETIFVSIASYRDPDCINTIESIYSRALIPQRIRTVVVEQLRRPTTKKGGGDDNVVDHHQDDDDTSIRCTQPKISCTKDPTQVLCRYKHLITSYEFDARLAVGPTFARHIGQRFYRGEYFTLQVDSHVRFTKNFDIDIIEQWKSAHNEMAILSTYLLDLNGAITNDEQHKSNKLSRTLMCNAYYEGSIIKNGQQTTRPLLNPSLQTTPTIHPFWAAGFSFGRGHYVVQVPYDQYLPMIFQGEEISMTVRGFTYGYDYYAPYRNVCFHMYALSKNRQQRLAVPLFNENLKKQRNLNDRNNKTKKKSSLPSPFKGLEEQAMKRLTSIIQLRNPPLPLPPAPGKEGAKDKNKNEATTVVSQQPQEQKQQDDYVNIEEDLYGLGNIRSPQVFYKTFGIHTHNHTMENHLCWFVGENMQKRFLPALRKDGMGIDYETLNYTFRDPAPDQP